jgi:hypothetical protein
MEGIVVAFHKHIQLIATEVLLHTITGTGLWRLHIGNVRKSVLLAPKLEILLTALFGTECRENEKPGQTVKTNRTAIVNLKSGLV